MTMWINTKRIIRNGVIGFLRNGFVSLATMLIMSISLFSIGAIMFTSAALNAVLAQLEEKVDINVYFATDAEEDRILALKQTLEAQPEVAEVTYISRDESLAIFRERQKDEPSTIKALEELGENPLGASLAVRAKEIGQYEQIAQFLEGKTTVAEGERPMIERINFFKNKPVIERLSHISDSARKIGFAVTLFLIFASIAIVFNTIRLAIYTTRDEISVMKLVGASNWYARGPFVVEGALYGFVSGMFVFAVMYPLAAALGDASLKFFGNFSTLDYYEGHAFILFAVLVGSGVLMGAISSFLAARRYLQV